MNTITAFDMVRLEKTEIDSMKLTFKMVRESDISELYTITRKTFISSYQDNNTLENMALQLNTVLSRKQLLREINHPNINFYLVYLNEELVAYFKLNFKDGQTDFFDDEAMELERIYVYEQFQGNGIGKMCLDKCLRIAKSRGCKFIWLGVWESDKAIIKFYERFGFEKFGEHVYMFGNEQQNDHLLRLDLK
ncbi:GNAT family N-acetyltransferase [Zhouia sp. PK063]|uniref:GNAT family N-acetyltransferase n=1 Tax=Zhouia sp. PK063 TaxID=3373602 RepID=UPI0037B3E43C